MRLLLPRRQLTHQRVNVLFVRVQALGAASSYELKLRLADALDRQQFGIWSGTYGSCGREPSLPQLRNRVMREATDREKKGRQELVCDLGLAAQLTQEGEPAWVRQFSLQIAAAYRGMLVGLNKPAHGNQELQIFSAVGGYLTDVRRHGTGRDLR